jgi:glycosyltransferase involved in cell wall biosynthesis
MKKHGIKEPFILFLGRFTKVKGIDVLLHAIKIVKKERVSLKTKFVIMGVDFGFQNEMSNLINKLKIENSLIKERDDLKNT